MYIKRKLYLISVSIKTKRNLKMELHKFEEDMTFECNRSFVRPRKWVYSVPPGWITDKISEFDLKNELEHINLLSRENSVGNTCCWRVSSTIATIGFLITFISIMRGGSMEFESGMTIVSIIGFVLTFIGSAGAVIGLFQKAKAVERGTKVAIEYVNSLTHKYNHTNLWFGAESTRLVYNTGNNTSVRIKWDILIKLNRPKNNNNDNNNNVLLTAEGYSGKNFCSNCGNNVVGAQFCSKCGTKV